MKYRELLTLENKVSDIAKLRDKDIRVEFKLFLTRFLRNLKQGKEEFELMREESEAFKEYRRKLNSLLGEFQKKDDAGNPLTDDNDKPLYEEGLRSKREDLEEEYKEEIDLRKTEIENLEILLNKTVDPPPTIVKIEKKYVPFKVLSSAEIETLYDYIIFPEDKKEAKEKKAVDEINDDMA